MLIDTTPGALESASADARADEEAGYDGAFTGEVSNDPFLPLALAAVGLARGTEQEMAEAVRQIRSGIGGEGRVRARCWVPTGLK